MNRPLDRRATLFWPCTAALLAAMASVQVSSMRQESQTWDEAIELASGYMYLKTGEYRIETQHPPLQKVISALPLLLLHPDVPVYRGGGSGEVYDLAQHFLYKNRVDADTMLFYARLPTMGETVLLGLAIVLWTRARFGPLAAVLALLFFTLDPTVIALGHYTKNDMLLTLFVFLSCIAWDWYLRSRRRIALAASGLLFGCAFVTKFSALFLAGVFAVLYWLDWRRKRRARPFIEFVDAGVTMGVITAALVVAAYAPYAKDFLPPTPKQLERDPASATRVASHPFLTGIQNLGLHNVEGHRSYLLGRYSPTGWWYYFPVALAVKEPSATLAALAIAAGLVVFRRFRPPAVVWIPPAIYLLLAMSSNIDIGIRHVLPMFPFLFILGGVALAQLGWRYKPWLIGVLSVGVALEWAAIYPNHLAFFNSLAGGPGRGPHYLLDSNIDWGQDAKKLKRYLDQHNIPHVCLAFFGGFDPSYYGIWYDLLPRTGEIEKGLKPPCDVAAVSVTALYDMYVTEISFSWLRQREPFAKVGYSIYLYNLKK